MKVGKSLILLGSYKVKFFGKKGIGQAKKHHTIICFLCVGNQKVLFQFFKKLNFLTRKFLET